MIKTIDGLLPSQKRAVNKFNTILKDKNIVAIQRVDDYYEIEYKNNQKFKCKGVIVENSMIYERSLIVRKRIF